MFHEVSSQVSFPRLEEQILEFWKANRIFEKSMAQSQGRPQYTFYEGPPTANAPPGIHHVLARVFKDLIPRYRTMKGYNVPRKAGWDTHGLPVELQIEKELGFTTKSQIEEYGVDRFNDRCRESVFRYVKEWERLSDRIGFWLDMAHPYITLSSDYIESVWWILRQLWDRGLLYQDYKVVPYCPRCGTPLSSHEVALGYENATDPSIYVKFPLADEPGVFLLAWTTTPWTLPGNVALAINPTLEYVRVRVGQEVLILAQAALERALHGLAFEVLGPVAPTDLIGRRYQPLYTFVQPDRPAYRVVGATFVAAEEGTGVVHIAPAFGEVDLEVGRQENLPILQPVDPQGRFTAAVTPWAGLFVKDADGEIIADLERRGLLLRSGTIDHTYPFCWRCDTPLLYYARRSWFIRMTQLRENLLKNNEQINWYPEHLKHGRFGNFLENVVDWALSRERYWGTPLPIWQCETCGHQHCIGSVAELQRMARGDTFNALRRGAPSPAGDGQTLDLAHLDLHRPYIDQVILTCPECQGEMRRVPYLIDVWFDSGAMPVAQWHYPFENQETFQRSFPADFICEGVDQTRGWFYTLHAIATALFDQPAFRNVISLGLLLDETGVKMSKSRGNVVDPWTVIEAHGADATRWYFYTAGHPGMEKRFSVGLVGEVVRRFLLTLWNTYAFFVTYARIDRFNPREHTLPARERHVLDRWILARLHETIGQVDSLLDAYDVTTAGRLIEQFVDDLSNWYVRRSRDRFWRSGLSPDKVAAHLTLYECLTALTGLIAPFMPFLSEALYQNLVRSVDPTAPESVHLTSYPTADPALVDRALLHDMAVAQRVVALGRAARNKARLRVRQPLAELVVVVPPAERAAVERLQEEILAELNIKRLRLAEDPSAVATYQVRPKLAQLGPKLGPRLPQVLAILPQLDGRTVLAAQQAGTPVEVTLPDGARLALDPADLEVQATGREGYAVAEEFGTLVAVDTRLTPDLLSEGLAREIVRHIQALRKEANFRIEDRILTYYQAERALEEVIERFADYIRHETLSRQIIKGPPPPEAHSADLRIDSYKIRLGVRRLAEQPSPDG